MTPPWAEPGSRARSLPVLPGPLRAAAHRLSSSLAHERLELRGLAGPLLELHAVLARDRLVLRFLVLGAARLGEPPEVERAVERNAPVVLAARDAQGVLEGLGRFVFPAERVQPSSQIQQARGEEARVAPPLGSV